MLKFQTVSAKSAKNPSGYFLTRPEQQAFVLPGRPGRFLDHPARPGSTYKQYALSPAFRILKQSIYGTKTSSQQTSLQRVSTINMVFSDDDKILKSFYLKSYTEKTVTDEFLTDSLVGQRLVLLTQDFNH